jgi:hypothetical protein
MVNVAAVAQCVLAGPGLPRLPRRHPPPCWEGGPGLGSFAITH